MRSLAVMLLMLASSSLLAKVVLPTPQQVDYAQQAISALKSKNIPAYQQAAAQLGEHPLQSYFDYYLVVNQLPDIAIEQVQSFWQKYPEHPQADTLLSTALDRYGKAQDWQSFLTLRPQPPYSLGLKCYYWRAQYEKTGVQALKTVPEIWLNGQSLPGSCDALFVQARMHQVLTDELVWQRLLLAFAQNNQNLVRHLSAALTGELAERAEFAERLLNDPLHILTLPSEWPIEVQNLFKKQTVLMAAQKDASSALSLLTVITEKLGALDVENHQAVTRKIVWFNVIRSDTEQREWTDSWLMDHADDELVQQRIRLAVREQNWPDVIKWTEQLTPTLKKDAHWQYWLGRALQQTGYKKEGRAYFEQAAQTRSFWGFLAADQIKASYAFNPSTPLVTEQPDAQPVLERIHWLMAVGETSFARAEWNAYLKKNPAQRAPFVNYAQQQQWPGMLIDAAGLIGDHNALTWRFPLAYLSDFEQVSVETKRDPLLYMAVARRESAFHPHVESKAGAVGLMQLMPATAAQVARWRKEAMPVKEQLKMPVNSIRLGTTYLNHLLDKFDNNRILALAAYNAGPTNVENWLGLYDMPYDVWIESIPFYETREYVQAVLSYRVIFEANQQQNYALKKSLLTKQEQKANYQQKMLKNKNE